MNRFPLPLNASLNEGERDEWTLLSPFQYIDPDLGLITVPEGYTTNFASVPRIPIIFDLVGAYGHAAAVLHDYLYEHTTFSRKEADLVFKNALRSSGHARWRTWLMYYGVRLFGDRYYNK